MSKLTKDEDKCWKYLKGELTGSPVVDAFITESNDAKARGKKLSPTRIGQYMEAMMPKTKDNKWYNE